MSAGLPRQIEQLLFYPCVQKTNAYFPAKQQDQQTINRRRRFSVVDIAMSTLDERS